MSPNRLLPLLASAWLGLLLSIGLLAAPSVFRLLDRPLAGSVVARLFAGEAASSLVLCLLAVALERWRFRIIGSPPTLNRPILLALGALFCTVAGYYALQPMMEAARAAQGALSFGQLHALSLGFYAVKVALVALLAWTSSGRD